jgi:hypothetical protein
MLWLRYCPPSSSSRLQRVPRPIALAAVRSCRGAQEDDQVDCTVMIPATLLRLIHAPLPPRLTPPNSFSSEASPPTILLAGGAHRLAKDVHCRRARRPPCWTSDVKSWIVGGHGHGELGLQVTARPLDVERSFWSALPYGRRPNKYSPHLWCGLRGRPSRLQGRASSPLGRISQAYVYSFF